MPSNKIVSIRLPEDRSTRVLRDRTLISEEYSSYFTDESKLQGDPPLSIGFPETTEQLAALLQEHSLRRESIIVSGTRSGVVVASVAIGPTHVISCEKMAGVLEHGFDEEK